MNPPKKSLGQHWLRDPASLRAVADVAHIGPDDTVLEIGPGLGPLTAELVQRAKRVVAVELDNQLAATLSARVPAKNLDVVHADILAFDLSTLPAGYKVAANLPYYITSQIVRLLLGSANPPAALGLLVQKEVAQRMAAGPGGMSILAVAVQFYAEPVLGQVVSAEMFTPPPKVDSQVIGLRVRSRPLFADVPAADYFHVVRAGFSDKRKMLRNSLSGGLHLEKVATGQLLRDAGLPPQARAEELSLEDWHKLARAFAARGGAV